MKIDKHFVVGTPPLLQTLVKLLPIFLLVGPLSRLADHLVLAQGDPFGDVRSSSLGALRQGDRQGQSSIGLDFLRLGGKQPTFL